MAPLHLAFRHALLPAALLVAFYQASAQATRYTDSLELVLKTLPEDTVRVLVLNDLAWEYASGNLQKAKACAIRSVALATGLHFYKGRGSAYNTLGNILGDEARPAEAVHYYQLALADKMTIGDLRGMATISNNIGVACKQQGYYKEALTYYQAALAKRIMLEDARGQGDCYNNIGNLYRELKAPDSALTYLQKAFSIRLELKDEHGIAETYNNIGGVYNEMGRYKEAIDDHLKAAAAFEALGDKRALVAVYSNIARINKVLHNTKGAIDYNLQALALAEQTGTKTFLPGIYNALGETYLDTHDNAKAKKYLLKALPLADNAPDDACEILNGLAVCAQRADNEAQATKYYQRALAVARTSKIPRNVVLTLNAYAEAKILFKDTAGVLPMLQEALGIARKQGLTPKLKSCYRNLSDYYTLTGKDTLAAACLRKSEDLSAALFTEDVAKNLAVEQTKYETGKKDKEIRSLKDEQEISALQLAQQKLLLKERTYQIVAIVSMISLLAALAFFLYKRQKRLIHAKVERDMLEAENRERIRIARDMHDDLGSGLSRISLMADLARDQSAGSETLNKNMERISGVSRELVENMRDLIWVLDPENTTLENLVTRIREYCGDAFEGTGQQPRLHVPESLPDIQMTREAQRNIFLTVKEVLHNCMKHAGPCTLDLTIDIGAGSLRITITDTGAGFLVDESGAKGNGLRNMQARIAAIGGELRIHSVLRKGTVTTIDIPLKPSSMPRPGRLITRKW